MCMHNYSGEDQFSQDQRFDEQSQKKGDTSSRSAKFKSLFVS